MIGAFLFLISRTTRNRFVSQLKRVKSPRYALGLIFGLGYFGLIIWNSHSRRDAQLPHSDTQEVFFDLMRSLGAIGLMLLSAFRWFGGADRTSLTFTQAEVTMLFPAPVSRRALILYKIGRMQWAVIFTSLLWCLIGRRTFTTAVAYWVILSTLTLHSLGIALVRASQTENGRAGVKRNWVSYSIFTVAALIVVGGLLRAQQSIREADGMSEALTAVLRAMHTAPVSWVTYPFDAILAPAFTRTRHDWFVAMGPAVVIFALHFLWVIRSDAAFEESAADASATQAKRIAAWRSRGIASTATFSKKNLRRTIPLADSGSAPVALVWKNYLWLLRTGQLRSSLILPLIVVIVATLAKRSEVGTVLVITMALATAIMYFMFGPMTLRNDLRAALGQVSIVKTYPMAGRDIMFAEVASSASAMAVMQLLLVLSAIYAVSFLPRHRPDVVVQLGMVVGAPLLILGLNLANFCIHNGIALIFPAWIRVGEGNTSGIENTGQMMLLMIITVVTLALLCMLPAGAAAAIYFMYPGLPFVAVAGAGLAAGAVLTGECWLLTRLLGGLLDRLEPMQVG